MKLTIISDTHGEHETLGDLSGDVLIHCGDMFNMFSPNTDDFDRMDDWFGRQDFDLIFCVGGNHDFELQKRFLSSPGLFENAVYLEGETYEYDGINFFGAPWVPRLSGQAFYKKQEELMYEWSKIPDATDVLITHTPPHKILDVSSRGLQVGCKHLSVELDRVKPILHCFGHVHASCGVYEKSGTTYVNAALVNSQYQLCRQPFECTL